MSVRAKRELFLNFNNETVIHFRFTTPEFTMKLPPLKTHYKDEKRARSALKGLNRIFGQHETLDSLLRDAIEIGLVLLGVDNCVITWYKEDKKNAFVRCVSENLAEEKSEKALWQVVAEDQGSSGEKSGIIPRLQFDGEPIPPACIIVSPIRIHREVVGVLHGVLEKFPDEGALLGNPAVCEAFTEQLGFAIESQKMRQMLAARYVTRTRQAQDVNEPGKQPLESHILEAVRNPEKVAKIIARSFYKDLRKAGFETNQILVVASEIIENLSQTLRSTKIRDDK